MLDLNTFIGLAAGFTLFVTAEHVLGWIRDRVADLLGL